MSPFHDTFTQRYPPGCDMTIRVYLSLIGAWRWSLGSVKTRTLGSVFVTVLRL